MPHDHKFERKYDRRATLQDEKARILDLADFHRQPPTVGIYEQPVRYFKANKEWCAFIFGFLSWMQHEAFWTDAEDTNYHAIQQLLIFEEGINGSIFMTPDEFKQSLYEGLYKWTNDVAKQIVSGGIGGFSVDEEGNVVVGGDGPADDVPDDPETPQNEEAEYKAGLALSWAHGLNSIFLRLNELFGPDMIADTPLEDAQLVMKAAYFYADEAAFDAEIAEYYSRRATGGAVITDLIPAELGAAIYCANFALTSITFHIADMGGVYEARLNAINLTKQMTAEQYNVWSQGVEVSTAYIAWQCTPIATEEFTLNMATSNAPGYITNGLWKEGHRFLIEIEGSYADSDLPDIIGDGMYFHDTSSGIKTFSTMNFNFDGTITVPTQAQVPFAADHKYRFTIEKNVGSGNAARAISRDNGSMNLPNVSGVLTVRITDLGSFAT